MCDRFHVIFFKSTLFISKGDICKRLLLLYLYFAFCELLCFFVIGVVGTLTIWRNPSLIIRSDSFGVVGGDRFP